MANFLEWTQKYGLVSAKKTFGLSDHLVFNVIHGRVVYARCGDWIASEPLGTGQSVEEAKQNLRDAIDNCHLTEEDI